MESKSRPSLKLELKKLITKELKGLETENVSNILKILILHLEKVVCFLVVALRQQSDNNVILVSLYCELYRKYD